MNSIEHNKSQENNRVSYRLLSMLALSVACLFLAQARAYSYTDIRMGAGLPIASVLGSKSAAFSTGVGGQFIFDIQNEKEVSYYLSIDYLHFGGNEMATGSLNDITMKPTVSDWSFGGGVGYYPLYRRDGVTPVLCAEYGFRFVSEHVVQTDKISQQVTPYDNSVLFQYLGAGIGAEYQVTKRLSVQGKVKFMLNIPMTLPENQSFVYTDASLNYLHLQFLASFQYRLTR